MKTFKKYLYWLTTPVSFVAFFFFSLFELIGHSGQEALHRFEAWCLNYKDTGLIYRGDGIYSSPRSNEEGYQEWLDRFKK